MCGMFGKCWRRIAESGLCHIEFQLSHDSSRFVFHLSRGTDIEVSLIVFMYLKRHPLLLRRLPLVLW